MSRFVDLSHVVHDGMPGIRLKRRDGTVQEGTARIRTWLGREAMLDILEGQAAFEVTELSLPTPIGTYIDSPFSRFAEGRDISELTLAELILPGVVVRSARAPYWGACACERPAGRHRSEGCRRAVQLRLGWALGHARVRRLSLYLDRTCGPGRRSWREAARIRYRQRRWSRRPSLTRFTQTCWLAMSSSSRTWLNSTASSAVLSASSPFLSRGARSRQCQCVRSLKSCNSLPAYP